MVINIRSGIISEIKDIIRTISDDYTKALNSFDPTAPAVEDGKNYYKHGINAVGELFDLANEKDFDVTFKYLFGDMRTYESTWLSDICWAAAEYISRLRIPVGTAQQLVDKILLDHPSCIGAGICHAIRVNVNGYSCSLAAAYGHGYKQWCCVEGSSAIMFMKGFLLHATMMM